MQNTHVMYVRSMNKYFLFKKDRITEFIAVVSPSAVDIVAAISLSLNEKK